MRILCSNDDGVFARGLAILALAARRAFPDATIVVIAPQTECSGYSHRITLGELAVRRADELLQLSHDGEDISAPVADEVYAVAGTPGDCVRLAMARGGLLDRARPGFFVRRRASPAGELPDESWLPDLVLSGVNHGANLGHDLHYSGTIAAAKEAAGFGVPAIAFSRLRRGSDMIGEVVGPLVQTIAGLLAAWHADGTVVPGRIDPQAGAPATLLNVNFPGLPAQHFAGVRVTRTAGYCYEEHFERAGRDDGVEGDYLAVRGGEPETTIAPPPPGPGEWLTDERAIADGFVSVTPLTVDWTRYARLRALEARAANWPATGDAPADGASTLPPRTFGN